LTRKAPVGSRRRDRLCEKSVGRLRPRSRPRPRPRFFRGFRERGRERGGRCRFFTQSGEEAGQSNAERGTRNAERGTRNAECGMRRSGIAEPSAFRIPRLRPTVRSPPVTRPTSIQPIANGATYGENESGPFCRKFVLGIPLAIDSGQRCYPSGEIGKARAMPGGSCLCVQVRHHHQTTPRQPNPTPMKTTIKSHGAPEALTTSSFVIRHSSFVKSPLPCWPSRPGAPPSSLPWPPPISPARKPTTQPTVPTPRSPTGPTTGQHFSSTLVIGGRAARAQLKARPNSRASGECHRACGGLNS